MSGFTHVALIACLLAAPSAFAGLDGFREPIDLTKRHSEFADKIVPLKMHELKVNEELLSKRIPIKRWHAEFSSIGQKRAPVEVQEWEGMKIIEPKVIDMKTFKHTMAPQNQRMAFVRNFDRVQEKELVPEYRDAEVVTVKEISVPAATEAQKNLSMRDLNRFSFQRNHSDESGLKVQRTVEEE